MRKRAFEILATYFFGNEKASDGRPDLLIPVGTLLNFWDITFSVRELFEGQRKIIYCLSFFQFTKKKT